MQCVRNEMCWIPVPINRRINLITLIILAPAITTAAEAPASATIATT